MVKIGAPFEMATPVTPNGGITPSSGVAATAASHFS